MLIHVYFLTMIIISLSYCCEKIFTHINTCGIGKNSKLCYLKKKVFTGTMEGLTDADYIHVKRVCKDFEIKI